MTGRFPQDGDLLRSRPVITEGMLDDLLGLNLAFLDLLGADSTSGLAAYGLPRSELLRLANLTLAQRRELAACPYSLFRLNLPLDGTGAGEQLVSPLAVFQRRHVCAVSGLLFAWHLARSGQRAARILLGLSATACEYLRTLSASHLPAIATRENLLIARFCGHKQFWPDLIQAATAGRKHRLEVTRLAGAQWLALGLS